MGYVKVLGTRNTTIAVVNQIRTIDKLRLYMKKVIGLNDSNPKLSLNMYNENSIMRLENDKVEKIIEAYNRYLLGENTE